MGATGTLIRISKSLELLLLWLKYVKQGWNKTNMYLSDSLMHNYTFSQYLNLWLILDWLVNLLIQQILFIEHQCITGSTLDDRDMKMNKNQFYLQEAYIPKKWQLLNEQVLITYNGIRIFPHIHADNTDQIQLFIQKSHSISGNHHSTFKSSFLDFPIWEQIYGIFPSIWLVSFENAL